MDNFSVVPDGDGWLCKRGERVLEYCDTVSAAIDLANLEASMHRPSEVALQDEDGESTLIAAYRTLD